MGGWGGWGRVGGRKGAGWGGKGEEQRMGGKVVREGLEVVDQMTQL
jgi:hypothetical protein